MTLWLFNIQAHFLGGTICLTYAHKICLPEDAIGSGLG